MAAQRLYRIIASGEFPLRKGLVDRAVTDLVQAHGRAFRAAFQLRRKVVDALPGAARDRPLAKRADRVLSVHQRALRKPRKMTSPQPISSVTPPMGVTAPSQRGAPKAME